MCERTDGKRPPLNPSVRLLSVRQTQAHSSGGKRKACWARRQRAAGFVTERCFFTVCSLPLSPRRRWKRESRAGPRCEEKQPRKNESQVAGKKMLSPSRTQQRLRLHSLLQVGWSRFSCSPTQAFLEMERLCFRHKLSCDTRSWIVDANTKWLLGDAACFFSFFCIQ